MRFAYAAALSQPGTRRESYGTRRSRSVRLRWLGLACSECATAWLECFGACFGALTATTEVYART